MSSLLYIQLMLFFNIKNAKFFFGGCFSRSLFSTIKKLTSLPHKTKYDKLQTEQKANLNLNNQRNEKPLRKNQLNNKPSSKVQGKRDMYERKNIIQQKVIQVEQKYGKDIQQLLQKRELNLTDLTYLSKQIQAQGLNLSQRHKIFIKTQFKQIKEMSYQDLNTLVNLYYHLDNINFPQSLTSTFVNHFSHNRLSSEQIKKYPSNFLKQIAYSLFSSVFKKNQDNAAQVLKLLGTLMSNQSMKKIDEQCCVQLQNLQINSGIRLLNIFRQIGRRGDFVDGMCELVILKQNFIEPKYLLMALINFFQLGNEVYVNKMQDIILNKMDVGTYFGQKELEGILQLFHKYKQGSVFFWQKMERNFLKKQDSLVFEHIFAMLSGFTRCYICRPQLMIKLIQLVPTFDYVKTLTEKQYIQFFLVTYFHFQHFKVSDKKRFEPILMQAIKSKQMKSVYSQIQNIFLFLLQNGSARKQYLKKAYPNDLMITLISIGFQMNETVDRDQQQEYEQELSERYGKQVFEKNKGIIVIEQFIRYKLVSSGKEQFVGK